MLKPDGLLVLKEATSAHDFNTLTFGLTSEWWGFDDPEVRLPGGPLLSRAGWMAALKAAGFRDPRAAGLPGSEELESVVLARAPLGERTSAPAAAAPSRRAAAGPVGAVETALLEVVADALHLSPDEVEPEGSFADYGADSIISVELVRRINARFEIDLKSTSLFNFATVRELARFIEIEFTDRVTPAPSEIDVDPSSVDQRVAQAKARTRRLRERIETRRRGAPVNAEVKFLAREASKDGVTPSAEPAAEATLEHVLARLEAGEIDVDEAMMVEVMDDA
jgi:polyketide synthase PksN